MRARHSADWMIVFASRLSRSTIALGLPFAAIGPFKPTWSSAWPGHGEWLCWQTSASKVASDRGGFFVGATLDTNGGLYVR